MNSTQLQSWRQLSPLTMALLAIDIITIVRAIGLLLRTLASAVWARTVQAWNWLIPAPLQEAILLPDTSRGCKKSRRKKRKRRQALVRHIAEQAQALAEDHAPDTNYTTTPSQPPSTRTAEPSATLPSPKPTPAPEQDELGGWQPARGRKTRRTSSCLQQSGEGAMHTQDSSGVKAASPVQASEGESDKGWKEGKPRRRARSSQESGAKTVTLPASQSLGKQGTAAHAATSVKSPRWSWSLGLRKPGMTYAAAVDSSKQMAASATALATSPKRTWFPGFTKPGLTYADVTDPCKQAKAHVVILAEDQSTGADMIGTTITDTPTSTIVYPPPIDTQSSVFSVYAPSEPASDSSVCSIPLAQTFSFTTPLALVSSSLGRLLSGVWEPPSQSKVDAAAQQEGLEAEDEFGEEALLQQEQPHGDIVPAGDEFGQEALVQQGEQDMAYGEIVPAEEDLPPYPYELTRFQAYTLTNALDGQDGVPWFDYTQILEPGESVEECVELGKGGYGAVYRFKFKGVSESVALKISHFVERHAISPDLGEYKAISPDLVQGFCKELYCTQCLSRPSRLNNATTHVNVMRPLAASWDIGYLGQGFIVMPLMGYNLQEIVEMGLYVGTPQRPHPKRIYYCIGVIRGLMYMHSKGMAHGDLKPANVVTNGDEAVVTDFGSSHHIRSREPRESCYSTIEYAAPEVNRLTFTNNVGHYDERADIYAAGALCNYVLTGKHEWVVKDKKEVNIFDQQDLAPRIGDGRVSHACHPDLNPRLKTVLSAAMDPSPDNRPSLEQIEKALLDTHEYVIATQ